MARLLGKRQSTVQHWAKSGHVPAKWQSELLRIAREHSIDLSVADFMGNGAYLHRVHFYDDDSFLIDRVARFLESAFVSGNAGVVIATRSHRERLAECLRRRGFDTARVLREGTYIGLDAAGTLAKFMVNGRLDESRFVATISDVIHRANRAAKCDAPRAAVFGEMVALLWKDGKRAAAIELEQMWNQLGQSCDFSLLCGYPMNGFNRREHGPAFMEVCTHHADVIPAESYSALTNGHERHRTVARLQQRSQALETEIRRSEEQLNLINSVAGAGSWEMDLADESILLSQQAQEMLGLKAPGRIPLSQLLQTMFYSGDRDAFLAAIKRARTGRKEFHVTFRIKRNNRVRVLESYAKMFYNSGQPLILGVLKGLRRNRRTPQPGLAVVGRSQASSGSWE